MKMKRVLYFVIAILVLILVIFLGNTFRKFCILKSLSEKVKEYESLTNFHSKAFFEYLDGHKMTYDIYTKDEKQLYVIMQEDKETGKVQTISTYCDNEKMNTFYVSEDSKTVSLNENNRLQVRGIANTTLDLEIGNWDLFLQSMRTKVEKIEYKGKECYKIKAMHEAYFEKETGIMLKEVGSEALTSEFEYEIGNVTDDIFIEPNISEYEIRE